MDEIIYNLLLRSPQGLTLLGTLRYRFTDLDALKKVSGKAADLLPEAAELPSFQLSVFQVEGSISVPLLTGLSPVPVSGIALVSLLGPTLITMINSNDSARSLNMQFNNLDSEHIGGGQVWRPGEPGELIFSVLGTQPGTL